MAKQTSTTAAQRSTPKPQRHGPTPPAGATDGQPAAAAAPLVHPAARWVADVLSTMSIKNQYKGHLIINNGMYAISVLSFIVAMAIGQFWICAYTILGASGTALALFTLNWFQVKDPEVDAKTGVPLHSHVDVATNEEYYSCLNNALAYLKDYSVDGKPTSKKAKEIAAAKDAKGDSATEKK